MIFLEYLRKEVDMNLLRELDLPNRVEGLAPYKEFDSDHSTIFFPRSSIKETARGSTEHRAQRHRLLEHLIGRLWLQDLPGKKHAERYLRHQYRCNCRPNTISNSYMGIASFLTFIKGEGKMCIEEITRWDLEAFIEHEQDRGLKLSTVKTRLGILKAFIRFLVEGGIV